MTSPVHKLMVEIRDFVNISWKHYMLRQDRAGFHQLVSALDTIEDAEEAIQAFETNTIGETKGVLYLTIYGLLQAFFVRQDATRHLCEALNIENKFSDYPQLEMIREIRNDTIGHPTKRDRPKERPTSYHQISRVTMSKKGYTLQSNSSDGPSKFRKISIPTLIADQNRYISEMLQLVIEALQSEVKAHKEKFRIEKLSQIFPEVLTYAFEKISESLYSGPVELGQWGLDQVRATVSAFYDAVKRRDMDVFTNLQDDLKHIERAIAQLEQIMDTHASGASRPEDEIDGHIYLSFLRDQLDDLHKYAKEIDDEYDND